MTRILSFAIALLAVAGVFLLPDAPTSRLAVLEVYEWVAGGAVGSDHPAWKETGPEEVKLLLGGARLVDRTANPTDSLAIHGELRDAIVRGVRQAAGSEGIDLELIGAEAPAVHGLNFLVELDEERISITRHMSGYEETSEIPFAPASPLSLLPPLVAICLAVLLRRPVISLFAGVLAGAYLLRAGFGEGLAASLGGGLKDVVSVFFWEQLSDGDRLQTVGFVVAMLAMVGVITRNGGIRGLMNWIARLARTARSTQIATFLMGLVVFFDDYANTILVGSTMRPLTDRFRIAREKLAYIVDSTAAPVAGLSIFSTWIAFEVSTFSAQLPMAGLSPGEGYAVFIDTLPYRFYCILTLALVGLVTFTGRDFGPMLTAEKRARRTGALVRVGGKPMVSELATAMQPAPGISIRAWRALAPLIVFLGVTLYVMLETGGAFASDAPSWLTIEGMNGILAESRVYLALFCGSCSGLTVAVLASLLAGMTWEIVSAAWKTLRSMGIALAILYLAWMIGAVCGELGTASYLTVSLDDVQFPLALPVILFLLSGAIAFATGSSWSTMSILLPLVVGLSFTLGERVEIGGYALLILSIGAVLEGSIFGDHCSPISDTTVLSSVASASDHIDHVRTQGPYAALTMAVAMVVGYLPAAVFGLHPALSLLGGVAVLYFALRILGERADETEPVTDPPATPAT
jgi:Na+/H+ antiporter NhaC